MRILHITACVLLIAHAAFTQTCPVRPSAAPKLLNNDICIGQPISVLNLSNPNGNDLDYIWDWGDGTKLDTLYDMRSPVHVYERPIEDMCTQPNGGYVYKIKLTAQNRNTGCLNHSTTTDAYAYFSPIADFLAPAEICIDYPEATFTNKTCPLNTPNTKIFWSFGDPASGTADTSTLLNPTHRFTATGLYTVKLTVSSFCNTSIKTMKILVRDAPTAGGNFTILSTTTVCAPYELSVSNTSQNATGSTWVVSPATGWSFTKGTDANSANPIIRFDNSGEYTLKLQINSLCGTRDWESGQKIIVKSKPQVAMDTLIGSCIPFTMSPAAQVVNDGGLPLQYKWTMAGGSISNANTFNPGNVLFAIKGTFPIKFRAENTCGADSVTRYLAATDKISIYFSDVQDTLCSATNPVELKALPAGGVWTGTGVSASGVFAPSVSGIGNFKLNYKVSFGSCSDNKDTTVHVFGTAVAAGGTQAACANANTASVLTGGFPLGGAWSGTGITNSANGIFAPSVAGAGTHTLTYTYHEPIANCPNTATKIITVNTPPKAVIDALLPVCMNDLRKFTQSSTNAVSFKWSFGDFNSSNNEIPSHAYVLNGTYDVNLIVTSVENCMDTTAAKITVSAPPTADFAQNVDEGCTPLSVNFNNKSTGVNATYTWDFGNNRVVTTPTPGTVIFDNTIDRDTQFNIQLMAVTPGCPAATASSKLTIFTKPRTNFAYDIGTGCSPLTVGFLNVSTGSPRSYTWNFGNGATSTLEQPANQKYYTDTVSKVYKISLISTNFCGNDTVIRSVTVTPPSVKAFFGIDKVEGCSPLTVNLSGAATPGATATYNLSDGTISNDKNIVHTFTIPGTYKIRQQVSGSCGQDSMDRVVNVWATPSVKFTSSQFNICKDRRVQFRQQTSPNVGVTWDLGEGTITGTHDPLYDYKRSGNFMVKLFVNDLSHGCKNADSTLIEVRSPLKFGFDSIRHSSCFGINTGAIVIRRGDVTGGLPTYEFALNDSTFKDISLSGIFSNLEGRKRNTIWVRDRAGCVDSASTYIKGFPSLMLDAGRDREIDLGDSTHTFVTTNAYKLLNLKWTPSVSVSCDTCQEVYLQPLETTTYTVKATGPEGCMEKTNITVRVSSNRKIFVPNVFSPDDDGNNDFFYPFAGKNIKKITYFRVFDRWGNLVFQNTGFQADIQTAGWDGKYKGEKLSSDVYIWSMELELRNGIKELYKGDVTLIR